jgi:superfamily II DNA or RNA helicase
MPRVNLLIADDVGLGKTIEAGMVMQELIARQRVRRILIVCPASLQKQWAEEMRLKFSLLFEIVDRDYVHRVRREYGVHVNPWASYPRLITSMDFLKREVPLQQFRTSLVNAGGQARTGNPAGQGGGNGRSGATGLKDWDLLLVDEAHNVAPTGRGEWVRDSDRTHMVREIMPNFEHRLFLTATPHNGYTQSFTAMLEMLDPLRFARCTAVNKEQLAAVMVRRIKDELVDALGNRRFPKREVDALPVQLTDQEAALFDTLDRYASLRLSRLSVRDRLPVKFAVTLLKKRLLSSVVAFKESIDVHHAHLVGDEEPDEDKGKVVQLLSLKLADDYDSDEEKDRAEEAALSESAGFFAPTDEELVLAEQMKEMALHLAERPDSKAGELVRWIEQHLCLDGTWNQDRLLVFTEYRHTLDYLRRELARIGWSDRVITLFGGMGEKQREAVKKVFASDPATDPTRILLATDAASEGLNLQAHCRFLIHYEIPWNPNKMEQRNGRIDRHGQKASQVYCMHFAYAGRQDQQFLDVVVNKVRTQRADLGSVGDVIAAQVEEALRGERKFIEDPKARWERQKADLKADILTREGIVRLRQAIGEARQAWHIHADTLRLVLDEALRMQQHPGLEPVGAGDLAGRAWLLKALPPAWSECAPWIKDSKGRLLALVFDDRLARDRQDVTLVHLDHPLMKRAVGTFRANLWSAGLHDSHRLHRASYRVVADPMITEPAMILVSRLVAVGSAGVKLHEELLLAGGEIRQFELSVAPPQWIEKAFAVPGTFPEIPQKVGDALRRFFAGHEQALRKELARLVQVREKAIRQQLRTRGTDEARQVRTLVDERVKEIDRRIKEMEKELEAPGIFLPGFEPDNLDQYRQDTQWLRLRRDQLLAERESEPQAVQRRYELRGVPRCFPLALLYLVPAAYVKEGV